MSYLILSDLYTHLQPEQIKAVTREDVKAFANLAAFPATGLARYYYKANDTNKYYTWDGDTYSETAFIDKVSKAINTGIGEAKAYLTRYNLVAMFDNDPSKRTFQSDDLDSKVKDLAVWHLLTLCNANANLEIYRTRYEDAIKYFEKVQRGIIDPPYPLKADDPTTNIDDAGNVEYRTNPKRKNSY